MRFGDQWTKYKVPKIFAQDPLYLSLFQYTTDLNSGNNPLFKAFMPTLQLTALLKGLFMPRQVKRTGMAVEAHLMSKAWNSPNGSRYTAKYVLCRAIGDWHLLAMELFGKEWMNLMEFADSGELSARSAKVIMRRCFECVKFLNDLNIHHLDIKDLNFMVNDLTLEVKIIDFGSAVEGDARKKHDTFRGTDALLGFMVCNVDPYTLARKGKNVLDELNGIKQGGPYFDRDGAAISQEAIDVLDALFDRDQVARGS
ncbi:hypothetical protein HDU76_013394 [Blyttiomyces sp. JEL0837]|nr:hypothetical protein HDU76_013394 [Blyttiomyces sp. JEL0837]